MKYQIAKDFNIPLSSVSMLKISQVEFFSILHPKKDIEIPLERVSWVVTLFFSASGPFSDKNVDRIFQVKIVFAN